MSSTLPFLACRVLQVGDYLPAAAAIVGVIVGSLLLVRIFVWVGKPEDLEPELFLT